MKKCKQIVFGTMLISMASLFPGLAAAELKIGFVDLAKLSENAPQIIAAQGKIDAEFSSREKELIELLLDSEKDWRVRRRVAFLLGDKRSYEVAEALAEAIRSDPSLDVIKECFYSFEATTGYRSPDLFEVEHLLDWWATHAVEVKKNLG